VRDTGDLGTSYCLISFPCSDMTFSGIILDGDCADLMSAPAYADVCLSLGCFLSFSLAGSPTGGFLEKGCLLVCPCFLVDKRAFLFS